MKISYTEKNIISYFNKVFSINSEWVNEDKEIGSIKYLLKKYEIFKFIEPVDYLLLLIDYVKAKGTKVYKIYDICNFEMEFAEILEVDIKSSVIRNKNTIIWR